MDWRRCNAFTRSPFTGLLTMLVSLPQRLGQLGCRDMLPISWHIEATQHSSKGHSRTLRILLESSTGSHCNVVIRGDGNRPGGNRASCADCARSGVHEKNSLRKQANHTRNQALLW